MNEEWRDVIDHNGMYKISNLGRIFSMKTNKILKVQNEHCGYVQLQLRNNGKMKHHKVHRLVAEAFIPNPESKRTVNHIDGNKKNNIVSNLEWATHCENLKHAHKTGLKIPQQTGKSGKLHRSSIPCISINQTAIIEHESINLCAAYFEVRDTAVHYALRKNRLLKGNLIYKL